MRLNFDQSRNGRQQRPFRGIVYGPAGVGKSTFAGDAPDPWFFDGTGGTDELYVNRVPLPESGNYIWDDLLETIDYLAKGEAGYRTLVIDELGFVERLAWDVLCKRHRKSDIEEFGFGKGYGRAVDEWRVLFQRLEAMQRAVDVNVVFVAHERVHKLKNPEGDDYGKIGPDVHVSVVGLLERWCDFMLFARPQIVIDTKTEKRFSTGEHIIHTGVSAAYWAKNRYNLPPVIELSWHAFAEAKDRGTRQAEEALTELAELTKGCDRQLAAEIKRHIERAEGDANKLARLVEWSRERLKEQESAA